MVGPRAALERPSLSASGVNWIAGKPPATTVSVTAQIRHRHTAAPARLTPLDDGARAHVEFDEPQAAVAPGQAVVFFEGETVVGGGWIETPPGTNAHRPESMIYEAVAAASPACSGSDSR